MLSPRCSAQATCGPQGVQSECELGAVLADTGHGMLPWVYAGSMVSVLVFGIVKGLVFTKTTLMASSWLHDHLFDKVQPRGCTASRFLGPRGLRGACGSGDRHGARGAHRRVWGQSPGICLPAAKAGSGGGCCSGGSSALRLGWGWSGRPPKGAALEQTRGAQRASPAPKSPEPWGPQRCFAPPCLLGWPGAECTGLVHV